MLNVIFNVDEPVYFSKGWDQILLGKMLKPDFTLKNCWIDCNKFFMILIFKCLKYTSKTGGCQKNLIRGY